MYHVVDNFLNEEDFAFMQRSATQHLTKKYGKKVSDNTMMILYSDSHGDLTRALIGTGTGLIPIIEKIKTSLHDFTENLNPIENIFFQYCYSGYVIPPHIDFLHTANLSNMVDLTNMAGNYKAFLYCGDEWQEEWGGELCFNGIKILPIPNRLVIYTTDETHWVTEIKPNVNAVRTFFGIRFGYES